MLKRAVDCALKQDYPNIEVIISDNCSDDGTEEMVRSRYGNEKRLIYHRNKTNIGPSENFRNAFYNICRGEYCIGLCDDDYFIDDSYISRAAGKLLSMPNIAFVYSGIYYNNMIEKKVYRVKPQMPAVVSGIDLFLNFTSQKYPHMPNPSTIVFRKENAIEANAFSKNPKRMSSDLIFELRLLLTGDACFDNGIVLVYNLHDASMSRNTDISIIDDSLDKITKAVESAKADISELFDIIAVAEKEKNIDKKTADQWLTFRIWKYMYWRVNETACSAEECKALLNFLKKEYYPLYDSLKQVAEKRFGRNVANQ
jgi:glycosyltransferase involved in cell wall biosynthesis